MERIPHRGKEQTMKSHFSCKICGNLSIMVWIIEGEKIYAISRSPSAENVVKRRDTGAADEDRDRWTQKKCDKFRRRHCKNSLSPQLFHHNRIDPDKSFFGFRIAARWRPNRSRFSLFRPPFGRRINTNKHRRYPSAGINQTTRV